MRHSVAPSPRHGRGRPAQDAGDPERWGGTRPKPRALPLDPLRAHARTSRGTSSPETPTQTKMRLRRANGTGDEQPKAQEQQPRHCALPRATSAPCRSPLARSLPPPPSASPRPSRAFYARPPPSALGSTPTAPRGACTSQLWISESPNTPDQGLECGSGRPDWGAGVSQLARVVALLRGRVDTSDESGGVPPRRRGRSAGGSAAAWWRATPARACGDVRGWRVGAQSRDDAFP